MTPEQIQANLARCYYGVTFEEPSWDYRVIRVIGDSILVKYHRKDRKHDSWQLADLDISKVGAYLNSAIKFHWPPLSCLLCKEKIEEGLLCQDCLQGIYD